MALADTLSRLPSPRNQREIFLHIRVSMVRFSTDRINKIRTATADNATLCQLTSMIMKGWPDTIQEVPPAIRSYWSFRDELSIEDGLIVKGKRVVIPESLRKDILVTYTMPTKGLRKPS